MSKISTIKQMQVTNIPKPTVGYVGLSTAIDIGQGRQVLLMSSSTETLIKAMKLISKDIVPDINRFRRVVVLSEEKVTIE